MMSGDYSLRVQLQDDYSDLRLAMEVLDRSRSGASRDFVLEWLGHVEACAGKCVLLIDQINRASVLPEDLRTPFSPTNDSGGTAAYR